MELLFIGSYAAGFGLCDVADVFYKPSCIFIVYYTSILGALLTQSHSPPHYYLELCTQNGPERTMGRVRPGSQSLPETDRRDGGGHWLLSGPTSQREDLG